MSTTCEFTLAELMIVAASEAWRDNGELIASGLGVIPRWVPAWPNSATVRNC